MSAVYEACRHDDTPHEHWTDGSCWYAPTAAKPVPRRRLVPHRCVVCEERIAGTNSIVDMGTDPRVRWHETCWPCDTRGHRQRLRRGRWLLRWRRRWVCSCCGYTSTSRERAS